jgi:hypothetical protein
VIPDQNFLSIHSDSFIEVACTDVEIRLELSIRSFRTLSINVNRELITIKQTLIKISRRYLRLSERITTSITEEKTERRARPSGKTHMTHIEFRTKKDKKFILRWENHRRDYLLNFEAIYDRLVQF